MSDVVLAWLGGFLIGGGLVTLLFILNTVSTADYNAALSEVKRLRSELASETAKKLYYKKAFEAKI